MIPAYASLLKNHFDWQRWEDLILQEKIYLDRPQHAAHPQYPEIIYPINYGYICNTLSSDQEGVDVFVGSGKPCLVGLLVTNDVIHQAQEIKLLWRCTPAEIYMAYGFINFDRSRLKGWLILRYPMKKIWELMDP